MRTLLLAAMLWVPGAALAGSADALDRGLASFRQGDFHAAVLALHQALGEAKAPGDQARAELHLAQSLERLELPVAASLFYTAIVHEGAAHPSFLAAVEALARLQPKLQDSYLIPSLLQKVYDGKLAALPKEAAHRVHFLVAGAAHRAGKLEEARAMLEKVPASSRLYAKARYLLGVVVSDPKLPGGPDLAQALKAFGAVLNARGDQEGGEEARQLALMGLGRTHYALRDYRQATLAYDRVPRFSKLWDQALFENGFARFQADDFGGALGSLQSLHAPQFAGAFQPESWILKATVYYYACLYDEARAAMRGFDRTYAPMLERLRPLVEGERDVTDYYRLIAEGKPDALPKAVAVWIRGNRRIAGVFEVLRQVEREKQAVQAMGPWRGTKLLTELTEDLDTYRQRHTQVAGQLVQRRLAEAVDTLSGFIDQAEILAFEATKAEKELAEVGVDHPKLLSQQALHRPAMPGESWNYYPFQGEFWIDEIGYYRYTLKRGCPALEGEATGR